VVESSALIFCDVEDPKFEALPATDEW